MRADNPSASERGHARRRSRSPMRHGKTEYKVQTEVLGLRPSPMQPRKHRSGSLSRLGETQFPICRSTYKNHVEIRLRKPAMADQALVTGFAGYGGRGRNPSGEVARALEGRKMAGLEVAGRILPVSYARLQSGLQSLLDELNPRLVLCLGLWPGEATIRLERIGINIANFEIPDNEGSFLTDAAISG